MNLHNPEIDDHWSPGVHTGTFRGPGLAFVAGSVGLDYADDEAFLGSVRAKGEQMRDRSEEDTSELQSRGHLVCPLLLANKELFNNLNTLCKLRLSSFIFKHTLFRY